MNLQISLCLDLIRFSAAMLVFIGHVSGQRFTGGLFWQLAQFMDEAVVIFFVLSGFVIAHVVNNIEQDPKTYAIARMSRLYSVALPAIVATTILDYFGKLIAPELYSMNWGYKGSVDIYAVLSSILFINQFWTLDIQMGSMLPYWSLSYEAAYYAIFGVFFFTKSRFKLVTISAMLLIAGPKIASMLPTWILGYFAYYNFVLNRKLRLTNFSAIFLCLMSVTLYLTYHHLYEIRLLAKLVVPSWIDRPTLFHHYFVAILFVVFLIGICNLPLLPQNYLHLAKNPVRWIAGSTFTIYLFHLPVAQFLTTVVPWPPTDSRTQIILFAGTLAVMFLLASVTERQKNSWNAGISKIWDKYLTIWRLR